jgi:two-component system sensor histidine kinase SenX3
MSAPFATTATSLTLPILVAIGAGILIGALLLGIILGRRTGRRDLAQRLISLGSRLGSGPSPDERSIEDALSYLEQITGAATEAVTETSAEAIRLRRSFDALPEGVVLCDESGLILFRNEAATSMMTGRGGDALVAQTVTELLAQAWKEETAHRELDLFGPPKRSFSVRAEVIDDGRRSLGVIAIIEDISERKRLDEIRRDFIANVSHELKTPMGALVLLSETLAAEKDRDVANRLANRINTEAFRVTRIIEDLLDLSRIETNNDQPVDQVSVNAVMHDAADRVRSAADHAGITIEVIDLNPPITVVASHRQLVSALHALIENAVAYSAKGSTVGISASLEQTVLAESEQENPLKAESIEDAWPLSSTPETLQGEGLAASVRIEVKDSGIGIPAPDLERIFERFYRVDRGRSRDTGGTGLGLAIVRHVAANHGGNVEVISREGEGSAFTLVIPHLEVE